MKRTIPYWQIGGFLFTAALGTLLHFLFDWTGGSIVVALFSAVNESIWEHLKLLFYPMLTIAFVEFLVWGKNAQSFWCIKLIGIFTGLVLIPIVYYTYTGISGVNADWLNIAIFFLAAGVTYWIESKLYSMDFNCNLGPGLPLVMIFLIAALFTILPS